MVSNDFEGKQQNDDMVRLIDIKILKNIDPEYQYNNKFWIKNIDDNKPFFKYEENGRVKNHLKNGNSKIIIPVVKDKLKKNVSLVAGKQSIRNQLPYSHSTLSDCKCKFRDKKIINRDYSKNIDEKMMIKSPKINKHIIKSTLTRRKSSQNETIKMKSSKVG